MRSRNWIAQVVIALPLTAALFAQSKTSSVISNIDLSKSFPTRGAWRLIATQGPPVDNTSSGGEEPGPIQLCLRLTPTSACDPQLLGVLGDPSRPNDTFTQPHYLTASKIVYPRGPADPPLLLIQTASVHSGNGNQLVSTQMLAYDAAQNHFVRIYQYTTGKNNNEEVRYISSGELKADIISVEPTDNAPYGYWVTVNVLTPQYTYRTALHYRSATHYGDNNPLAVIDSEMPNIEEHLGYWKSGMPLPLPGLCPNPHLIRMELWCK